MTYDHFGGDGYMASVVEAAFGVGMIAGSIVLMAWGGGKRLAGLIAVASLIVGVTTTACGFLAPTMFRAFVALCAVMALACSWFNGPLITLIQRNVPEEKTVHQVISNQSWRRKRILCNGSTVYVRRRSSVK